MHKLIETIINDVDGSKCGRTESARSFWVTRKYSGPGAATLFLNCVREANAWLCQNDREYEQPDTMEILQCAMEVVQYYRKNFREVL